MRNNQYLTNKHATSPKVLTKSPNLSDNAKLFVVVVHKLVNLFIILCPVHLTENTTEIVTLATKHICYRLI